MCEVFSKQPLRRFVHSFLMSGTELQLWVFDRSGAYSSDSFDVREKPERSAIAGYALMSDEELGLDNFMQQNGREATISMENTTSEEIMKLKLGPFPFVFQRSIVSRGTICYYTTDGESVAKFSWRSADRIAKSDLLKSARSIAGVVRLVCAHDLTSTKELRSGLNFSSQRGAIRKTFRLGDTRRSSANWLTQIDSMTISGIKRRSGIAADKDNNTFKKLRRSSRSKQVTQSVLSRSKAQFVKPPDLCRNRILTCIVVSPAGRPLREFRSPAEFLTGMRDAISAHKNLFMDEQILHRDISENNIILTDPRKTTATLGC